MKSPASHQSTINSEQRGFMFDPRVRAIGTQGTELPMRSRLPLPASRNPLRHPLTWQARRVEKWWLELHESGTYVRLKTGHQARIY